jgi:SAM-dependent methyltransferase
MNAVPASHYQSFAPGMGSSDSFGKLDALRFPDLTGKRFLDLGCNHGFFCFAALERGAASAVGVDRDPQSIEAANARARELGVIDKVRFVHSDCDGFDECGFDIAIILSALHYAPDQAALLRKVAGMLNRDGMLILEGGIIDNPRRDWTSIIRGTPPNTDIVDYPTRAAMFEMLSECYAPRERGPSVIQPGDNVPRFVWHCPKRKRMVLSIGAPPTMGKTTLGDCLRRRGVPLVDIDILIVNETTNDTPIGRIISPIFKPGWLDRCIDAINAAELQPDLADLIISAIEDVPPGEPLVAVMGASLMSEPLVAALREKARERHMVLWESARSPAPDLQASSEPTSAVPPFDECQCEECLSSPRGSAGS